LKENAEHPEIDTATPSAQIETPEPASTPESGAEVSENTNSTE
jgi:hypothetical protein